MTSYFYVSKIGGGKPSYQHPSFECALAEAKRLIDTIGGKYEILEARVVIEATPKYLVNDLRETGFSCAMETLRSRNDDDSMIPF